MMVVLAAEVVRRLCKFVFTILEQNSNKFIMHKLLLHVTVDCVFVSEKMSIFKMIFQSVVEYRSVNVPIYGGLRQINAITIL